MLLKPLETYRASGDAALRWMPKVIRPGKTSGDVPCLQTELRDAGFVRLERT